MIQENVKQVMEKIGQAAIAAGRSPEDITLVGVTKTVTYQEAKTLMEAGVTNLGENRVQSLLDKYEHLKNEPTWHLIGHLQTNKVKYIADKVSLIHSVDSAHLAEEINRQFQKAGRVADILVQVNVSGEESKFGLAPGEVFSMLEAIAPFHHVHVRGLMTMAPFTDKPEAVRKYFYDLRELSATITNANYGHVVMEHLSMGMSGDFYEAILEGATIVRVGSALFAQ